MPHQLTNVYAPYYAWIDAHLATVYNLAETRLAPDTAEAAVEFSDNFKRLIDKWNGLVVPTWAHIDELHREVADLAARHQLWRPLVDALEHVYLYAESLFERDTDRTLVDRRFVTLQIDTSSLLERYDRFIRAIFLLGQSIGEPGAEPERVRVASRIYVTAPGIVLLVYSSRRDSDLAESSDAVTRPVEIIDGSVYPEGLTDVDETPAYVRDDDDSVRLVSGQETMADRLLAERRPAAATTNVDRYGRVADLAHLSALPYGLLTWSRFLYERVYDVRLIDASRTGLDVADIPPIDLPALLKDVRGARPRRAVDGGSTPIERVVLPSPIGVIERQEESVLASMRLSSYLTVPYVENRQHAAGWALDTRIGRLLRGQQCARSTGLSWSDVCAFHLRPYVESIHDSPLRIVRVRQERGGGDRATSLRWAANSDWNDVKRQCLLHTVVTYFMNERLDVVGTPGYRSVRALWTDERLIRAWPVPSLRLFRLVDRRVYAARMVQIAVIDGVGDTAVVVPLPKESSPPPLPPSPPPLPVAAGRIKQRRDAVTSQQPPMAMDAQTTVPKRPRDDDDDGGGGGSGGGEPMRKLRQYALHPEPRIGSLRHGRVYQDFTFPLDEQPPVAIAINPSLFVTLTLVRLNYHIRTWYMRALYDAGYADSLTACHPMLSPRWIKKLALSPSVSEDPEENYVKAVLRASGNLYHVGRAAFEGMRNGLWLEGRQRVEIRKPEEANIVDIPV